MTARVRRIATQATLGDIDGWWDQALQNLLALVGLGWRRSRDLSTTYLSQHAGLEGVTVEPTPAVWSSQRVETSLRVRGPVLYKSHIASTGEPEAARAVMARTLPATAQRLVMAGNRDTIAATVEDSDSIVGWRRVIDEDPCAFCALLASRGAVYNEQTVRFEAHDGDECMFEPLYEHEDEPPEVQDLYDQYREATAGRSGKAAIRAWRNYWMARERG